MTSRAVIKPRRLEPGQTVGVVAPGYNIDEDEQIHAALETVASLGYRVKASEHLFARHGYFAGDDPARAADLLAMFADPEVAGIICLRGGYGCSRLLPLLDFDLIRRNPKVLVGYSDVTALLNPIHDRTGLVTFHGPLADQTYSAYTLAELRKVVVAGESGVMLGAAPSFAAAPGKVERTNRAITLAPGVARGRLVGGNLTLLAHLAGTPFAPDTRGALLFIEDVDETVYSIDRMLTQLWLAGCLQAAAGIVLGKFTELPPPRRAHQFTLEQVLRDRCGALGIPVVRGLMIGHVDDQTTVPIGCLAELDADRKTLTLLEAAVAEA